MQFQTSESNVTTFGNNYIIKSQSRTMIQSQFPCFIPENIRRFYFSQAGPALECVNANQVHFYTHGHADSKHQALKMIIEGTCESASLPSTHSFAIDADLVVPTTNQYKTQVHLVLASRLHDQIKTKIIAYS
jgi:hypothetical protein